METPACESKAAFDRQIGDAGHVGAAHQHGKDAHTRTPQALAYLVPDPVFRKVDAPAAVTVDDLEPVWSDDHDDRGAGIEPALHGFDKIGARIDAGVAFSNGSR